MTRNELLKFDLSGKWITRSGQHVEIVRTGTLYKDQNGNVWNLHLEHVVDPQMDIMVRDKVGECYV